MATINNASSPLRKKAAFWNTALPAAGGSGCLVWQCLACSKRPFRTDAICREMRIPGLTEERKATNLPSWCAKRSCG